MSTRGVHSVHSMTQMPDKIAFRPTEDDWELIERLQARTALTVAGLIRLALRKLAQSEGLVSNAAD